VSTYQRRRSRRRHRRWNLLWLVALAVALVLGIGLGEALHDGPSPAGTQTLVRTLRPLPLTPQTVTVTTSKP
jgi:hypothetical protein